MSSKSLGYIHKNIDCYPIWCVWVNGSAYGLPDGCRLSELGEQNRIPIPKWLQKMNWIRSVLPSVHYATNTCLPPGGERWLKNRSMFTFFLMSFV